MADQVETVTAAPPEAAAERPTHDAEGNRIVYLVKPIKVLLKRAGQPEAYEEFSQLTFHEFKARDMRAIDGLGENAGSILLAMMARMVRQPVAVVDELGTEDTATLTEMVQSFTPIGQLGGKTT